MTYYSVRILQRNRTDRVFVCGGGGYVRIYIHILTNISLHMHIESEGDLLAGFSVLWKRSVFFFKAFG